MVRHQRALFAGWLGRTNFKMTIDCDRVATDHLARKLLRERNRKRGFARTRGSKDDNQQWFRLIRRRGAHSTRTPGDGPAKTEECQGKDKNREGEQAENFDALPRTISRFPICVVLASV